MNSAQREPWRELERLSRRIFQEQKLLKAKIDEQQRLYMEGATASAGAAATRA